MVSTLSLYVDFHPGAKKYKWQYKYKADFGLAMEVKEPIFTVVGTPTYVAPEILSEIGLLFCFGHTNLEIVHSRRYCMYVYNDVGKIIIN